MLKRLQPLVCKLKLSVGAVLCIGEAGRQVERERNPSTSALSAQTSWEARNTEKPSARNLLGTKRGLCFFPLLSYVYTCSSSSYSSLSYFWTFAERKRCRQRQQKRTLFTLGWKQRLRPRTSFVCPGRPQRDSHQKKFVVHVEERKTRKTSEQRESQTLLFFSRKTAA
jgi:hypothetical protein